VPCFYLTLVISPAGQPVVRRDLGLPESWSVIKEWIDDSRDVIFSEKKTREPWKKKNPNIPPLNGYRTPPQESFGDSFPAHYPTDLKQTVKVDTLKKYIEKCWHDWTLPQKRTATKAVAFIEAKVPAPLKEILPGLIEKNAPSAFENGEYMTDVLATWVKKDALTKRPPTKHPVNISPQTKCPLNILPQVTFCPSDIWTFMGWIVRPLFTPSFLP
jgi:hypothetical protein